MLKHLVYRLPTIGQIKIGHMDFSGDKPRPVRDPYIRVASQVKNREGEWYPHPVNSILKGVDGAPPAKDVELNASGEIVALPIRLKWNESRLNFHDRYEAYDVTSGKQVCASEGVGENFKRPLSMDQGDCPTCPGPEMCAFGKKYRCGLFARLHLQIDGQGDSMSSFIFRTRGFNSVTTLRSKLVYLDALTGGHVANLPLILRLRASTKQLAYGREIYYCDITLPDGVSEIDARRAALANMDEEIVSGFPRADLEKAMLDMVVGAAFSEDEEDVEQLEDWLFEDRSASAGPSVEQAAAAVITKAANALTQQSVPGAAVGLAGLRANLAKVAQTQETAPDPSASAVAESTTTSTDEQTAVDFSA